MKSKLKAFALIITSVVACSLWPACTPNTAGKPVTQASDVRVADPEGVVRDARQIIADYRKMTLSFAPGIPVVREDLPPSLLLPNVQSGTLTRDRFDLVLGKDAQWTVGVRVWGANANAKPGDQPTAYQDIYFFREPTAAPKSP